VGQRVKKCRGYIAEPRQGRKKPAHGASHGYARENNGTAPAGRKRWACLPPPTGAFSSPADTHSSRCGLLSGAPTGALRGTNASFKAAQNDSFRANCKIRGSNAACTCP
jgi:hypothetical protein